MGHTLPVLVGLTWEVFSQLGRQGSFDPRYWALAVLADHPSNTNLGDKVLHLAEFAISLDVKKI